MSLHRQALWSILPLATVTAVNLVSVPLFYRFFGPDRYALWLYVITLGGAFGFMDLGLGVAVGRYIGIALGRDDRAAVESYWATGNVIAVPLLIVMGTAFALVGLWFGTAWFNVASADKPILQWCFVMGGLNIFLGFYGQFWMILSQAFLDFKFLSIVRVIISLAQIIPALALARWTQNPLVLVCWSGVTALLQLILFVVHAQRTYGLRFSLNAVSKQRAQEMASYTGKVFLTLLCGSVAGSVDRLLLGKLASAHDFTSFNTAANAGGRIQSVSQALMAPVFHNTNRVVTGDQTVAVRSIYTHAFDLLFGFCVLAVLIATFWGRTILQFWLGSEPELAASVEPIFAPLVAAFALQAVSSLSSVQLASLDRQGLVLGFQIVSAVFTAVAVWCGWQIGGIVGAAYGLMISRLTGVAQDLTLSALIKGGGWLSSSVWILAAGLASISAVCVLIASACVTGAAKLDLLFLMLNGGAGFAFLWMHTRKVIAAGLPDSAL